MTMWSFCHPVCTLQQLMFGAGPGTTSFGYMRTHSICIDVHVKAGIQNEVTRFTIGQVVANDRCNKAVACLAAADCWQNNCPPDDRHIYLMYGLLLVRKAFSLARFAASVQA